MSTAAARTPLPLRRPPLVPEDAARHHRPSGFPRASGAGGIARRPARQPDAGRHFAWKGGPTRLFDPGGSLIPQRQPAPGTMWGEGVGAGNRGWASGGLSTDPVSDQGLTSRR